MVTMGLAHNDIGRLTLRQFIRCVEQYDKLRDRQDQWNAVICATIANTVPRKGKKKITPKDFLPKHQNKRKAQTNVDMIRVMDGMARRRGAKIPDRSVVRENGI